jgi:hypothetical protein
MAGKVNFEYDTERNIIFTDDRWTINTPEDVDVFFAEYKKFFDGIGKKVYMVSHIDNLSVQPAVLEYYGDSARRAVGQYILGFARWGSNDLSRMSIRTSSMKAHLESHIYRTREEAVQYIEELKKNAPQDPPASS